MTTTALEDLRALREKWRKVFIPAGCDISPRELQPIIEKLEREQQETIERCYMAARGPENRFEKLGTRQLYWKGRSDAATDVRALASREAKP